MRILVYGAAGELYGGIESFLLNMNDHMSDACVFDYVINGDRCIYEERVRRRGGRMYFVTSYKKSPLRFLSDSVRTARLAKPDHPVAYFNLFSMCHIAPVLICKALGYRIVLHSHNNDVPNKSKAYRLIHRLGRLLLSGMRCLRLTNSPASGIFMFGRNFTGDKSAEMIYNAIEARKFQFMPELRQKKRSELGLGDSLVIGFAGRLCIQKNPLFLLEIFAAVNAKRPDSVLLVAGEGAMKDEMTEKVKALGITGSVRFLGHRTDMSELYQAMDRFVLPSLFEGLGIVLVEAQASGLPCFASAGVIPEEVRISAKLLQFIPLNGSPQMWAERILQTPEEAREGWSDVVEAGPFNISTEAKRLEKLLTVWR